MIFIKGIRFTVFYGGVDIYISLLMYLDTGAVVHYGSIGESISTASQSLKTLTLCLLTACYPDCVIFILSFVNI